MEVASTGWRRWRRLLSARSCRIFSGFAFGGSSRCYSSGAVRRVATGVRRPEWRPSRPVECWRGFVILCGRRAPTAFIAFGAPTACGFPPSPPPAAVAASASAVSSLLVRNQQDGCARPLWPLVSRFPRTDAFLRHLSRTQVSMQRDVWDRQGRVWFSRGRVALLGGGKFGGCQDLRTLMTDYQDLRIPEDYQDLRISDDGLPGSADS